MKVPKSPSFHIPRARKKGTPFGQSSVSPSSPQYREPLGSTSRPLNICLKLSIVMPEKDDQRLISNTQESISGFFLYSWTLEISTSPFYLGVVRLVMEILLQMSIVECNSCRVNTRCWIDRLQSYSV